MIPSMPPSQTTDADDCTLVFSLAGGAHWCRRHPVIATIPSAGKEPDITYGYTALAIERTATRDEIEAWRTPA